ncbi:hypothetical protein [Flavobacterium adhaerens]|uniref:hypothetical protein n=1 Tax=Flavobacterium adhaerens TaxID=3149043 RepID=UPI0032B47CA3
MKKSILKLLLLALSITTFTACSSSDDDNNNTEGGDTSGDKYAMFIVTDETAMSGVLVPFDKMPEGEINVSKLTNVVQLGSCRAAGVGFNGAIYHTSNTAGQWGVQKFTLNSAGSFVAAGFLPTGNQYTTGNNFGFISNTKGYYTNSELSQTAIQIFNPETMVKTGSIDLSTPINTIKETLTNVAGISIGGFMIQRDGKFFTEIFFLDSNGYQVIDKSYIAVVDTATDKLDKIITVDDFKLFGYGLKNCNYVTIDAKNDIYLGAFLGNFNDAEGPNFAVYRIKSGQTNIDSSWRINSLTDFTTENFGLGGEVLNGKMYLKMFTEKIDITFKGMSKKTYAGYELDLATKELKKIEDIPVGYWKSVHGPAIYNGKPYFIVEDQEAEDQKANGKKAYYYAYDPATGKSTKVITVIGGQPQQIIKL